MNFSLQIMARELSAAIAACATVADANSKIPILRTTRIAVDGGFASMIATNTEQTITVRAACAGAGVACIDTALLSAKIQTLRPNEPVAFEGDGKFVTISQGRTKWRVPVLLDDFPMTSAVDGEPVRLGKDFIAALNQTFGAASVETTRYYLCGTYMDGNCAVTTDGRQMRVVEFDGAIPNRIIVPAKVVGRVTALFPDGCAVIATDRAASFSSEFVTLKTNLIEGTYPDYRRVIPELGGSATVDADEFSLAISRATAIKAQGDKSGAFVPVQLTIGADEIQIVASNSDGEEGSDFCRCERANGSDVTIGFSGAFLVGAVQSMVCDTIEIRYGTESDPIIMAPVGSARENIRVIMPRRI